MHVGLTYDLRADYLAAGYSEEETAEFDRADTIDAIESALRELGHETDRIGSAMQLVNRLAAGDRWEMVFNIAEGLRGPVREAQVPFLLDLYNIPYTLSDPQVMTLALDKGLTKGIMRAAGLPTPDFAVVRELDDLNCLTLPFPLFAKPLAEGTGKGVDSASKVADHGKLRRICEALLARYCQPVLVETYLPGREFTVGVLGTGRDAEVVGTLEVVLLPGAEADAYSYVNKERCEEVVDYRLCRAEEDEEVRHAEAIALAAYRALGCRDAGRIDLRSDAAGQPQFIEINPLAGLHPEHSDLPILCNKLGMPYTQLIGRIVGSASDRLISRPAQGRLKR
jgi:D-alanine-D-alanine ligase